jgi:two-component system, cell cycle response regulator CpdR
MAKVMIAEDEDDIRQLLVEALRGAGFEVVEAETGDAASWLIEIEHPELLLASTHIRGSFSGLHLAKLARARHPGLPVLFVMNRPTEIVHMTDFEQPFAALAKPLCLAEVVGAVQRFVREAEGDRPSRGFV